MTTAERLTGTMETVEGRPTSNRDVGAVRVYRLASTEAIHLSASRIARELFGMEGLQVARQTFTVHPVSGYLFYSDRGGLWQGEAARGLPPRKDVERLARAFLQEANRRIAGSRALGRERVGPLFPSDVRRVRVGAVVPKGSRRPDHWLCQFAAYLPVDQTHTARVEGALVDVRIGARSRVIGLGSRWRPIAGDVLSDERDRESRKDAIYAAGTGAIHAPESATLPSIAKPKPAVSVPTPEPTGEPHGHDAPPEYVYWLADENAPQTFLSPMYLEQGGEHRGIRAASAHTLNAEIWQRTIGSRIECIAAVAGGSGRYEYQWSYWTPGGFFDTGIAMLGTSQVLRLERGAYQILLGVRDRITGALVQTEKAVYPAP